MAQGSMGQCGPASSHRGYTRVENDVEEHGHYTVVGLSHTRPSRLAPDAAEACQEWLVRVHMTPDDHTALSIDPGLTLCHEDPVWRVVAGAPSTWTCGEQACSDNADCVAASFTGGESDGYCYLKSKNNGATRNDNVNCMYNFIANREP